MGTKADTWLGWSTELRCCLKEGPQRRGSSTCKAPGIRVLFLGCLANNKDATVSMSGVGGGGWDKSRECYRWEEKKKIRTELSLEPNLFCILRKLHSECVGSQWRALSRKVTWSDLHLKGPVFLRHRNHSVGGHRRDHTLVRVYSHSQGERCWCLERDR